MSIRSTRKRKSTGLSPTEEFYITGAKYDDQLPADCNKWEWFDLWCGGRKIDHDRRQYLEGLRKQTLQKVTRSDLCQEI